MMKIGLLGGSFNPPHIGHIHISNLAIKNLALNQVWWLPTKQNPLKELNSNYTERFLKCLEITKSNPKIKVKRFDEIYTNNLVEIIQKKYPNIDFYWVAGADNLENMHKWKDFKKLLNKIPFAIVSRETFLRKLKKFKIWNFLVKSKKNHKIFFTKNLDISSTKIRK